MATSFVHLHLHTEYSMLDGAARVSDVVATAVTDRYRANTGRSPNAFAVSAVDGAGLVATS